MADLPPFVNEPVLELRRAAVREQLTSALDSLDAQLPLGVPVIAGGDVRSDQDFESTDPGRPDRVVAHVSSAREAEVADAVVMATRAHRAWSAVDVRERARALVGAAQWLR